MEKWEIDANRVILGPCETMQMLSQKSGYKFGFWYMFNDNLFSDSIRGL